MCFSLKVQDMGRHSIEQKRIKRRKQKRNKRQKLKLMVHDEQSEESTSSPLSSSSELLEANQLSPLRRQDVEPDDTFDDTDLFAALDRVGEESDQYWEKMTEEKIREFDSYRDTHPCIMADKERTITVVVDGTGKYKGTSALKRVEIKDYFSRMMKKEEKATELCRVMRDRIETLEDALKDSKVKMMKMHRENQRKIEKVRYFWRNKIFEGNSRGGELLKAALIYPDVY